MTRNTTWTGCRADSSGRTLCGDPARALRFRPARRLRPRFWGAGNSGSCSGSELPRVLPRIWPRLEPVPVVMPIMYSLTSACAMQLAPIFLGIESGGPTRVDRQQDKLDTSLTVELRARAVPRRRARLRRHSEVGHAPAHARGSGQRGAHLGQEPAIRRRSREGPREVRRRQLPLRGRSAVEEDR